MQDLGAVVAGADVVDVDERRDGLAPAIRRRSCRGAPRLPVAAAPAAEIGLKHFVAAEHLVGLALGDHAAGVEDADLGRRCGG